VIFDERASRADLIIIEPHPRADLRRERRPGLGVVTRISLAEIIEECVEHAGCSDAASPARLANLADSASTSSADFDAETLVALAFALRLHHPKVTNLFR